MPSETARKVGLWSRGWQIAIAKILYYNHGAIEMAFFWQMMAAYSISSNYSALLLRALESNRIAHQVGAKLFAWQDCSTPNCLHPINPFKERTCKFCPENSSGPPQ